MSMMIHPNHKTGPVIRKLEIGNSFRVEFLKRLRAMNIHRASLFPDSTDLGIPSGSIWNYRIRTSDESHHETALVLSQP